MLMHASIYIIFVNEILASPRPSNDPDLAPFSGPIKIAQTLAGLCFWSFLDRQNKSMLERQHQQFCIDVCNMFVRISDSKCSSKI